MRAEVVLAAITWKLFAALTVAEMRGHFVRAQRTGSVRVAVVLAASAELAKLRILWDSMSGSYLSHLYLAYVGMKVRGRDSASRCTRNSLLCKGACGAAVLATSSELADLGCCTCCASSGSRVETT